MKFKKVQIQAFRAYDKVENGTFDFTNKTSGKLSDFVSIYAPNGFGKTSFYDAVEWGFTNNINRFLRRPAKNADAAKAERTYKADAGNKDKQHIIRNRHSSPDLPGYVRLSTTLSEDDIVNDIPDVRSGEADFKFKLTDTKQGTEYFQDVVLSQEWIDAFLKEDDASIRYDKFIAYFGDKNIDHYYKTICSLIKANETNIARLKKELKTCQTQLNFNGDKGILGKVNDHITKLREKGLVFPVIDEQFQDADFLQLSNDIAVAKSKLQESERNLVERAQAIERLIIGTTEEPGMSEYFDVKEKEQANQRVLQELAAQLDNTQRKVNAFDRLTEISQRIEQVSQQVHTLTRIRGLFDNFRQQSKEEHELGDRLALAEIQLSNLNRQLDQNKLLLTQIEKQITELLGQIEINKFKMVDQQAEQQTHDQLSSERVKIQGLLSEVTEQIRLHKITLIQLDEEIKEQQLSVVYIENQNFEQLTATLRLQYKDSIDEVNTLTINRSVLLKELVQIQQDIDAQEKLNSELTQFALSGIELIKQTEQSHCPLCNTDFKTFGQLAEAISKNEFLSSRLQASLQLRQHKEEQAAALATDIIRKLNAITDAIKMQTRVLESEASELGAAVTKSEKIKGDLQKQINKLNQQITAWSARFSGFSPAKFNEELDASTRILRRELEVLQERKKTQQNLVPESEKTIAELSGAVARYRQRLEQIKKDNLYLEVTNYLSDHFSGNASTLEALTGKQQELAKELAELELERNEVGSVIAPGETETSVKDELTVLLTQAGRLEKSGMDWKRVIVGFERSLGKLDFDFDSDRIDSTLQAVLERESASIDVDIAAIRLEQGDLTLLEQLQTNVMPYLTYQRTRKAADDYTARIKILKDKVNKTLAAEKKKVSDHIHEQVKSFFYEGLINDLYQKIDPHPEYKRIKFQCDFGYDKPRLNVFVVGENDNNPLVPNLYFSTAQMNILSLSIFLAKALNAKDGKDKPVNCIFIDDPIQSMDSINILSTIDLLRGIMVKFKKQIILSTHDENFHNLLKKKIPSDKADATYLELETFGTVKAEA